MSNRRVILLTAVAALAVACVSADALAAVAVRGGAEQFAAGVQRIAGVP
jgi:hypothetical protein